MFTSASCMWHCGRRDNAIKACQRYQAFDRHKVMHLKVIELRLSEYNGHDLILLQVN
jgi:hypothetical protein